MILRPDGKPFIEPNTEAFHRAHQEACDAAERLAKEQLRIETELLDRHEELVGGPDRLPEGTEAEEAMSEKLRLKVVGDDGQKRVCADCDNYLDYGPDNRVCTYHGVCPGGMQWRPSEDGCTWWEPKK